MRPTLIRHPDAQRHEAVTAIMWTLQVLALAAFILGCLCTARTVGMATSDGDEFKLAMCSLLLSSASGAWTLSTVLALYLVTRKSGPDQINGQVLLLWTVIVTGVLVLSLAIPLIVIGHIMIIAAVVGLPLCGRAVRWRHSQPTGS